MRSVFWDAEIPNPYIFSHYPIIISDASIELGKIIKEISLDSKHVEDDVIDKDIILLWADKSCCAASQKSKTSNNIKPF